MRLDSIRLKPRLIGAFLIVAAMVMFMSWNGSSTIGDAHASSDSSAAVREALSQRHSTGVQHAAVAKEVKQVQPAGKGGHLSSATNSASKPLHVSTPVHVSKPVLVSQAAHVGTPVHVSTPVRVGKAEAVKEADKAQPHVGQATEHEAGAAADKIWADLVAGNARFMAGEPRLRELVSTRKELVKGQSPKVMVLTCSDSRVCPELIFDKSLGDLFVIRTAGNIADPIVVGSIEYAVEHLGATVLVVLGHEKCGAVTAACKGGEMPTPSLAAIVNTIAPAVEKVKGKASGDELVYLAIEENVHEVVKYIETHSPIVEEKIKAGELKVVGAVYSLGVGDVVRLR